MVYMHPFGPMRTLLTVQPTGAEVIRGSMFPWTFRPHFHGGDEVVRLLAGRARLRIGKQVCEIAAGTRVVVPAGAVHRFEPVDQAGWAFASEFVRHPNLAGPHRPTRTGFSARVVAMLAKRSSLHSDMKEIAEWCDMSAGYLARVFRRETGTSLHNFHVFCALHKAKELIQNGVRVVEAALDAGFYDQAHLNREFVRTFGMTPGAFRTAWIEWEKGRAASR